MLKESFKMSFQNILGNKMRSFLTTLGIIIGVTAIIALITIVEGATMEITNQFTKLGAGKITIQAPGTLLKHGLLETDVAKIENIENISGVSPNTNVILSVSTNNQVLEEVYIEGKNHTHFEKNADLIKWGRGFSPLDMESGNRICIINNELANKLFLSSNPLEETLTIMGQRYTVVGILNPDGDGDIMSAMNSLTSGADDYKVIIPYKQALKISGTNITSLEVFVDNTDYTNEAVSQIEGILAQAFNYKDNAYTVFNLDSLLDTMNTMLDMMKSMLAGIASIALLVGGIGIMNMMLVSVTERTSEIGLRKALGAQPKQIQLQFLIESVVLSVIGGIVGILLGNFFSYIAAQSMNFTFQLSAGAISLGFGFSLLVGIIFGWAPARKASRLNPIDALRSM